MKRTALFLPPWHRAQWETRAELRCLGCWFCGACFLSSVGPATGEAHGGFPPPKARGVAPGRAHRARRQPLPRSQVCVCPETRPAGGAQPEERRWVTGTGAGRGGARRSCGDRRGREGLGGTGVTRGHFSRGKEGEGARQRRERLFGRWAGPGRALGRGRSGSTLAPRGLAGLPQHRAEAAGPRASLSTAPRFPSFFSPWRSSAGPRRSRELDTCRERAGLSGEGPMEPDGAVRRGPRAPSAAGREQPLWGVGGTGSWGSLPQETGQPWAEGRLPAAAVLAGGYGVPPFCVRRCGGGPRLTVPGNLACLWGRYAADTAEWGQHLPAGSALRLLSSAEGLGLCTTPPASRVVQCWVLH